MHQQLFRQLLNRPKGANKYDFGHVLVVGGSPGMVGAPLLTAEAALRTGAGLVTIASAPEVIDKLEKRVREIMTLRLQPDQALATLTDFIQARKVNALVIGGGHSQQLTDLDRQLILNADLPMVIDAGALNALADDMGTLERAARKNPNLILTPHTGEFVRLLGHKFSDSLPELREIALNFAAKYGVCLVLKGPNTLVTHSDGQIYQNTSGNPGLATAGTGDVLSGIIGGLIAQGVPLAAAAEMGVYLHGLAGDHAAQLKTDPGMIASDVIEAIPVVLKDTV